MLTQSKSTQGESGSDFLKELNEMQARYQLAIDGIHAEFATRQPAIPETVEGPVTIAKTNQSNNGRRTVVISLPETPNVEPDVELTRHQREIIRLVSTGHTTKAIAEKLNLHPGTIGKLITRLLERFQVQTRTALVMASLPYLEL